MLVRAYTAVREGWRPGNLLLLVGGQELRGRKGGREREREKGREGIRKREKRGSEELRGK